MSAAPGCLDGITLRPQQLAALRAQQRWGVLVWHRRAGKTVVAVLKLLLAALASGVRSDSQFAYVAPTYEQARDIAWSYLKRFARAACGGSETVHETLLRVTLPNGASIRLYGSQDPDRLRGLYLDGAVLDEPADQPGALWRDVLRPALSDRGGWAWWIGTPRGRDDFCRIYQGAAGNPDWYASLLPASTSGIISDEELRSAREAMGEGPYAQEYECDFAAAIASSYFDGSALRWVQECLRDAAEVVGLEEAGSQMRVHANGDQVEVWERPERNGRYVIGLDVAGGSADGDQHSGHVLKIGRAALEQVARFAPVCGADDIGRLACRVGKWYGTASLGIESNGLGLAAILAARETGYRNLYRHTDPATRRVADKPGWVTNATNRLLALGNVGAAIRDKALIIRSRSTYDQMTTFIYDKHGKPQAMSGCHDDEVMALAIALGVAQSVPVQQSVSNAERRSRFNDYEDEERSWKTL